MKTALIIVLCACLASVAGNIVLGAKLKTEFAEQDRMAKMLGIEEASRSNFSQLTNQIQRLKLELAMVKKSHDALRSAVEKEVQIQDICGLYFFDDRARGAGIAELDIRSDGTGRLKHQYSPIYGKPASWELTSNKVVFESGVNYRVEGADLIDVHGNRWLRQR